MKRISLTTRGRTIELLQGKEKKIVFFTLEGGEDLSLSQEKQMALTPQLAAQKGMSVPKETVLIVEDDIGNAATLDLLLQLEHRYQSFYFASAEEVLANLDIIQAEHPALFILDYLLPKMNGLELSRRLHTTEGLENVPVIMVTGNLLTDKQRVQLAQHGLVMINKPYDIDDMLDTIRQLTT